ncbi:MAG: SUMF1/EgtB/PvdO family nonheme iron enzyme [Saprospiraceae bacterium]|nr:SUMF1/EgtB/PvdO family nonheme iron enzyme [Saprospiraceae bacterium]
MDAKAIPAPCHAPDSLHRVRRCKGIPAESARLIRRLRKRACIEGTNRVVRGGSWNNNPENCRVANRNRNNPDNRNNNIGFRLVFVP